MFSFAAAPASCDSGWTLGKDRVKKGSGCRKTPKTKSPWRFSLWRVGRGSACAVSMSSVVWGTTFHTQTHARTRCVHVNKAEGWII